jgi:AcrR family transcriptional regulator
MASRSGSRRRTRSTDRRAELVEAALASFVAKGVTGASVDDIVAAAGVAKGTFYLYFASKDEAVTAVAERMVEAVGDRVEAAAGAPDRSAVERLLALGEAMADVGRPAHERDLLEFIHRPENLTVHEQMSDRIMARLAPTLTTIIGDGVDDGTFCRQDAALAATFVLGVFSRLHDAVRTPEDLPRALAELDAFVLRGLGHRARATS